MRRGGGLVALLLLVAAPAAAQDNGYESVTVGATAVGLTTASYAPGGVQMAMCVGRLETAEVRYRTDGTAPTTTEGILLEPGDTLTLGSSGEMVAASLIRTGSVSGVLKVSCVRQLRAQIVGSSATLSVDNPGAGATNLGKAEDAAHTSGDTGVEVLGVRKDTNVQSTNADGDYTAPAFDAYGAQFIRQDHPNRITCVVQVSTATTLTAVGGSCIAPGAGLSLYLTDILFSASATGIGADAFPTLKSGTGGTCGTATAIVWGALTAAAIVATDNRSTPIKITANSEVCWISSTAGSKFLVVGGYIAP